MDQEFTLPLQVAYLLIVLIVMSFWLTILFIQNKKSSAKISPQRSGQKLKWIIFSVALVLIFSTLVLGLYNLYIAIFQNSNSVNIFQNSIEIIQSANNVLLYLGIYIGSIIPVLIIYLTTAYQYKYGVFNKLPPKIISSLQTKSNLINSKIMIFSTIQGINWIFILLGFQYFMLSAFWQGFLTMSLLLNVVMQVVKLKLKKALRISALTTKSSSQ